MCGRAPSAKLDHSWPGSLMACFCNVQVIEDINDHGDVMFNAAQCSLRVMKGFQNLQVGLESAGWWLYICACICDRVWCLPVWIQITDVCKRGCGWMKKLMESGCVLVLGTMRDVVCLWWFNDLAIYPTHSLQFWSLHVANWPKLAHRHHSVTPGDGQKQSTASSFLRGR